MASAPGNMCQNCYPSAAHPIPSIMAGGGGRRRASRADPMDCEESQQWGTHLLNVADPIRGKSPWEIGHSPPSSSTRVIFSSRSMHARCYAGKTEPVLGQTRNEILEDKMFARSEIGSPLLFCTFSRSNSTFSRASPAFVALSSPPPSPSLHPFDAAATAATNLMSVAPSIIR